MRGLGHVAEEQSDPQTYGDEDDGTDHKRRAYGLDVVAAGSPTSYQVECPANTAVSVVEATTTAGAGSLSYDVPSGTYNYVWKTESSWAGTCRTFDMILDDGSSHQAMFRFVR